MRNDSIRLTTLASLTALLLLAPGIQADGKYYRWTNSDGTVQISDRPPPQGTDYETGTMAGGGNFVSAPKAGDSTEANTGDRPRMAIGENPGGSPEVIKDPVLCENARQNLEALQNFVRIRVQDPDGSYRILSPEQKDAEIAKAQKTIELNCD